MNREYYKKQYELAKTDVNPLIDRIFDYFESRTCSSCKYCDKDSMMCINKDIIEMDEEIKLTGLFQINKDFGCNKWEEEE